MALAGPRLDRPSAIGDEGRPRTASLWIATLCILAVITATGYLESVEGLLSSLALVAGLTVAGVALLGRESFLHQVVANCFVLGFGSALLTVALVVPITSALIPEVNHWFLFVTGGFAVALFGIGLTWADAGEYDAMRRVTVSTGIGYLSETVAFIGTLFFLFVLTIAVGLILSAGSMLAAASALLFFVCVLGVSSLSLALGLAVAPIEQLLSRHARSAYGPKLRRLTRLLAVFGALSLLLFGVLLVGLVADILPLGQSSLLTGFASPVVIWPIAGVGALGLVLAGGTVSIRLLARGFASKTRRRLAPIVAGCVLAILLLPPLFLSFFTFQFGLTLLILYAVFLAPLLLLAVFGCVMAGMRMTLLPTRASGPAIAAIGMVLATVGLGRSTPILAFGAAASAIVVWTLSTYGLSLTAELGHLPKTSRLELVAGVSTVAIAALVVVGVLALDLLRAAAFSSVTNVTALLLVAIGIFLLAIPIRG